MRHTTKTLADELNRQHSSMKRVVEYMNQERHILFLEKLKVTKHGRVDSKLPRWCYVLNEKQVLFLKLYLDPNRLGDYILTLDLRGAK